MLLNCRFVIFFFLIFILFSFNNIYSQTLTPKDSIKPYCSGVEVEEFIKDKKIESLEIRTNKNKKWTTNLLKALLEFNSVKQKSDHKDWFSFRINENYKKKFKANLTVKFINNDFPCKFKAKIRLTGDLWWHLDWRNGHPVSSLHVEILDGHVNSITKFKLLLPKSRNDKNEVFDACCTLHL